MSIVDQPISTKDTNNKSNNNKISSEKNINRIFPPSIPFKKDDIESSDEWGFEDSGFNINENGHATFTGKRYGLSGLEMPVLVPWICDMMQVEVKKEDVHTSNYPNQIPDAINHPEFLKLVKKILKEEQISEDAKTRLRHGHGQTQEEMYNIKYGKLKRIPDLVVYPTEEEQVRELVAAAVANHVVLIPFGGGTSVTEALSCPENEIRFIVSVDMKFMNRILWIDKVNRMACIQAGAVGRHISNQLEEYGFTMGHEPDSIEFSTLGGWIATNASGMKKNKYGNIEDIVLDVNVVTVNGELHRSSIAPRESVGTDPRQWIFGSEGNLGIITSAIVKLFELPEAKHYGSIIFPSFEEGTAFMYDLAKAGNPPASVRLVDNVQFKFSMALKPATVGMKVFKKKMESFIVTKIKGFDPDKMVVSTLVFEGSKEAVEAQEKRVYRTAAKHGGMKAGSENGEKGYQLTFSIAYLRDWIMKHYLLGESFETSVPWSQLLSLCENTKARIFKEHAAMGLPGRPFVTCRVTQVYDTGACVYFYLGISYKGLENPPKTFNQLENIAREEILSSGGSLSHHHGIGKLRQHFLPQIMSKTMIDWNRLMKEAVDPDNIFGVGNLYNSDSTHSNTQNSKILGENE
ncbi:MAG: FAD-binding oxidoreductase [Candidatus Sericytochromatia bacterium]|nr:FAD-binding oxidoreductase [Candidatus Sericytochromatia bacterium]